MFAAIEVAFGRTFLSLCRSASVSDCFRSIRCCHLRFSWLSSRCLPIATQYYWKGLPPLAVGTHCALRLARRRGGALRGKSGKGEHQPNAAKESRTNEKSADLT